MEHWNYKPARDQGLSGPERLRSTRREPGTLSLGLHACFWAAMRGYLRAYHGLRIEGVERLPKKPPFVIIANHTSHLDAMVLGAALPAGVRRMVYPIAAGDVFFEQAAVTLFAAGFLNALPMWRKSSAIRHALGDLRERLVDEPCGFILFPEGRRVREGAVEEFKAGLGMIVAGQAAPVVPCYLEGAFEAMPPGRKVPRPGRIVLRVGEALTFAELPNERASWDVIAVTCREAVMGLGRGG